MAEVPEYLIELLDKARVSNAQLARYLNLSRPSISRKLSGDRPLRLEELERIVEYLKRLGVEVDPERLLPGLFTGSKTKRRPA